jgi:glutathione S-transferase
MQLYGSTRSPFARKVMVAAHELGLADRITLIPVVVGATTIDPVVVRLNPLGQIPTLVLDDGRVIHDSLVICDYLDASSARPALFPRDLADRVDALTRHALGQGITETLVRLFGERKRVGDPLHPAYAAALRAKFVRAADALERDCHAWPERPPDIGDLAIAVALAYADFRFAELDWPSGRDALYGWYRHFAQRPAMLATAFVAPPA